MRSSLRHPSDIPIDFQLEELVTEATDYLKNVSRGGLAFHSKISLPKGTTVRIKIPLVSPVFQATGKVTWCHPTENDYEIGIQFIDEGDPFRARMVEQICHIEQYKHEVFDNDGRQLSGEQAAVEWIEKFAADFPGADNDSEDKSKNIN